MNFYAPALVAFSGFSPFFINTFKKSEDDQFIRSVRMIHRSEVAPLIEWHQNENFRIEFKFFDMALSCEEYRLYFDFCLILLTSDKLKGISNIKIEKENLIIAAIEGLNSKAM